MPANAAIAAEIAQVIEFILFTEIPTYMAANWFWDVACIAFPRAVALKKNAKAEQSAMVPNIIIMFS